MKTYIQKTTKENPLKAGWYNTDKGELFWYESEKTWSCRDDRLSEEYPNIWYKEVLPQANVIKSVCEHEKVEVEPDEFGNTHYCSKCRQWNF